MLKKIVDGLHIINIFTMDNHYKINKDKLTPIYPLYSIIHEDIYQ